MNRFIYIICALLGVSSSAHTHDLTGLESRQNLEAMRLIDRGDGSKPRWMTFEQAMQLGEKSHEEGRCGGFMDVTDAPALPEAALPLVETFKIGLADRALTQQRFLSQSLPRLSSQELYKTVTELSAFKNRYFKSPTGVQAADYIVNRFKAYSKNRTDIRVDYFKHPKWAQPSVVATIAGQGSKANEIVVIGGHEDSINQGSFGLPSQNAPGADDNATGVATVLEVFREIVESGFRPQRTLMFMTYAAEEVGLLGSQEIANTFRQNNKSIVAVMQLDMTSYPGAGDQIVFMTDFTHLGLTQFAQKLVDTYVKVQWSTDQCNYACSDHASWHKAGFAAIMPFEATMAKDNKSIHTKNDVIQKLDFNHGLHFAQLGLAFMTELSKDQ